MKRLRIFAASPSDMATERTHIERAAAMLKPLADYLDIMLDVADWNAVVPDMGRPEQLILDQLDPTEWDVFIGILWHRFGTPPGDQDTETRKEYLAGTEEEFKTAYRLWKQYGKPRIMIYRCTRSIPPDALDPDQFKRVKEFFAQFEAVKGEHPGLYQSFETTEAFDNLLLDNLQKLLLQYSEQLKGEPVSPEVVQAFAPKVPDNLPRRASFFGREKEMEIAMRALSPEDRTWGALVDGIGGIGKSALAIEAAYRCKANGLFEAFVFVSAKQNILDPNGIRELKPAARTLDEFLNETARVLGQIGIAKLASADKRRALLDALRSTRTLLIYDNLETLTKEEQESVADFLRELPTGCKALITSRRRGGEGAVWLRLEKLDWDGAREIIAEEATKDAALAQKLHHATEARWHELYDETKGSPLALVHVLGLMRVRASLNFDGALDMLRGNRNPDLQKFIFQEARRELTTNDEAALRALSFFAPSATFEAWTQTSNLSRNALETTIDRLSALSLVDLLPGEERYALHPLTRNFVRDELLADVNTEYDFGMLFADYWVDYAMRYGGLSKNYKTFNLLEAELANLNATEEWLWQKAAVHDDEIEDENAVESLNRLGIALCDATGPLFFMGLWDESLQLSIRVYSAMSALNNWKDAGGCAYEAFWINYSRANINEAARWAARCSEAIARDGNEYDRAMNKRMHGMILEWSKDYDKAERLYQELLAVARHLKFDLDVTLVLNDLGRLEYERKHYDKAERYYRESLFLAEKSDDMNMQTVLTVRLGRVALARESLAEAHGWFERALRLAREIARQDAIAAALHGLARAHEAEEHPDLALPLGQESLAIRQRLQHPDLAETIELVERLKKKVDGQEHPPGE
jgi:tetratricopeptide (TPR) repeat protein